MAFGEARGERQAGSAAFLSGHSSAMPRLPFERQAQMLAGYLRLVPRTLLSGAEFDRNLNT